jgi:hypothetical protein
MYLNSAERLERLLDRLAIEDCIARYCHAVDRCDPDLLKTVYWPGAIDDHIFWRGTAEEFVEYCMPILRSREQTTHSVSNLLVRFDGPTARVESHVHAYERLRRKGGTANDVVMHGRYLDRFEKREGEWRIADRKVILDWWRVYPDSCDWERGLFGTRFEVGQRGAADPSATLFGTRLMQPLF